jgi:hypothetical protein
MPPSIDELKNIPNAAQPTPGMGLTLDHNGLLSQSVLAPSPVTSYVLTADTTVQQQKWSTVAVSSITGYPNDATKFLRGDGTWASVSTSSVVAPTHIMGGHSSGELAVTANSAYLVPIFGLVTPSIVTRICWTMATLVAGNYDVGIYFSDDEATFTRLVSKGSTAQPAAGNIISTIGSTTLTPVTGRRWYIAIALDSASAVGITASTATKTGSIPGYVKTTSFVLPSSLTGMSAATFLPALTAAI